MNVTRRLRRLCSSVFAAMCLLPTVLMAANGDITLRGQIAMPNSTSICDVWGYYDAVAGKEYAIVGEWFTAKLYVVDVTDPTNPSVVKTITGVPGFDHKVYDHYLYSCDGNSTGGDSRIIDIADPLNPVVLPTKFSSGHNISISDNGLLALEFSGLKLFDLSIDAANPDSLWHSNTGDGHDSTPKGNLLYDFHGYSGFRLWDVTNPSSPTLQETVNDPFVTYFHSGDTDPSGRYLYVCDELAEEALNQPDIIVYDMNTSPPTRGSTLRDANSTVHNLYIIGNYAFVSHYTDGFKVLNVSDPANPVVADEYDTSIFAAEGYDGCFGVYPFAQTGYVYVSDWDNGLYIFEVEGYSGPVTSVRETPSATARLEQNYPNPFNPATTIAFELDRGADVTLRVFDVRGGAVRTLASGTHDAGRHEATWNGTNDAGRAVASGVYFYRLDVGPTTTTKRMVLLK